MCWQRQRCRQGLVLLGAAWMLASGEPAAGQRLRNSDVLNATYFQGQAALYSAEFTRAVEDFRDAGKGAIREGDVRWIDSICYHAMAGESCFQTGQMKAALDHFGTALRFYLQYDKWMEQVQFPPRVAPRTTATPPIPWGRSQRQFRLGQYSEKYNIRRGRTNVLNAGKQTFIQPGEMLMTLHAAELARTTTLAIRRRRELLGPAAPHDPLLRDVVARLAGRPGQNGPLSEAWIDVQLGYAYASVGRNPQAITTLTRSLVVGGDCDHPLTGLAMLELGRLAAENGDLGAAANWYAEAGYSGFHFMQPDVIEEALRQGAILHMLGGGKGIYPPLIAAAEWAQAKRLRTVQATALCYAAENAAVLGDSRQATAALNQAGRILPRKDANASLLGARINYMSALAAYQRQQPKVAEPALAAAMQWQKTGSLKLFQIAMADQCYRDGTVEKEEAVKLFGKVLEEPTAADWRREPMEGITVLLAPQDAILGRWLEAAMSCDDWKSALEISDRIRRRRFYSTLPLGGRILSLRWLLEGPEAALPAEAVLQRNDLLARNAAYRTLAQQAEKLMKELHALPAMPEERDPSAAQLKVLTELARVHASQDVVLLELALRREPAAMVFPPQRPLEEVQKKMAPGQALLVFQSTNNAIHGFLVTPSRVGAWKLRSPEDVRKRLGATLRAWGNYDLNREVETTLLSDPTWRGEAAALLAEIMQGSKIDLGQGIQELVVVPDDMLWYVPFEALPLNAADKKELLVSRMRVRYAPTIGLAVSDGRNRKQAGATGVVMGRVFPHESEELSALVVSRLKQALPQTTPITRLPAAPSAQLARRFDSLVVLDDLEGGDEQAAYQLAPMRFDRGRPGSRLEDWLRLPPLGPEVVVLPGFHTPAENGLKRLSRTARAGDELFLTSCALMASGARTVLISRWRTGGRTCNELAAEFLQELPNTPASDAWQRAVEVARHTPLDLSLEPRAKLSRDGDAPMADNPFFWAGYMVIDTGTDPRKKQVPNAAPPARPAAAAPAAN